MKNDDKYSKNNYGYEKLDKYNNDKKEKKVYVRHGTEMSEENLKKSLGWK